jgi:hypothetical protein
MNLSTVLEFPSTSIYQTAGQMKLPAASCGVFGEGESNQLQTLHTEPYNHPTGSSCVFVHTDHVLALSLKAFACMAKENLFGTSIAPYLPNQRRYHSERSYDASQRTHSADPTDDAKNTWRNHLDIHDAS